MIGPYEHASQVWYHEANPTHDAADGDARRGNQRRARDDDPFQQLGPYPERPRFLIAHRQHIELPANEDQSDTAYYDRR